MKYLSIIIVTLTLFATIITGCAKQGAVISGTVKLQDGTPIKSGNVAFTNGKQSFFGVIKADGTYIVGDIKGTEPVPQGNYTVYLTGVNKEEIDFAAKAVRQILIVDPKYCSSETSDITYFVKTSGRSTFHVTVPKPGEQKQEPVESKPKSD